MQIRIEALVQKGQGLGRGPEGKVYFVQGALPGELVEITSVQEKKDYCFAKVNKIIEQSPHRVSPPCPYYGLCGGCNLMHLEYGQQLKQKNQIFIDTLKKFKALSEDTIIEPPLPSEPFSYRTRARLETDKKNLGFSKAQSNSIININSCLVLAPSLNTCLQNKEVLIKNENKGQVPLILSNDKVLVGNKQSGHIRVLNKDLPLSNKVFFQSNLKMLEKLITYIMPLVIGPKVMDLYSGIGTFSAFLEDEFEVLAVERDPLCLNLAMSHLKKTEFFTKSVESFGYRDSSDTIIVDPPRVGLEKSVPKTLALLKPKRIIYVSCDSVTLCRDIALFKNEGYKLTSTKLFDFYPQTFHMESVSVLDRL